MQRMTRNTVLGLTLGMLGLSAIMLAGTPIRAAEETSAGAAAPEVIAVKFHADWCGSCKTMGDIFTDLANKLDGQPVLFVELDQTNRTTASQAQYMLAALGAGDLWSDYGGKTGFILLIDGDSKEVVGKLTKEHSVKDMAKAVNQAVGTTS